MNTPPPPPPPVELSFENLPSHVLAAILGGFCNGKALSTVLLCVAQSNARMRPSALPLCQGVLVQRYMELAAVLRREGLATAITTTELIDVLDVIREDIRKSFTEPVRARQDDQDEDHVEQDSSSLSWITKFSWWCAVLDYMERHWKVRLRYPNVPMQWMVWNGTMEVPYGPIQAVLTTQQWTAGALSYWCSRELSSSLILSHPRNSQLEVITLPFYGTVMGMTGDARHRLYLQNRDLSFRRDSNNELEEDWVSVRRALIAMNEIYATDPSVALVASPLESAGIGIRLNGGDDDSDEEEDEDQETSHSERHPSMKCYWDAEEGEEGDWEDAVAALGEHIVRIMNKCSLHDHHHRARSGMSPLESCLEDVYSHLEEVER